MASSDLALIGAGLAQLNALWYHHLVPFALIFPTSGEHIYIIAFLIPHYQLKMAPKGGNAKKESGRAKKADNESKKAQAADAERERKEAEAWRDDNVKGGKAKKGDQEERRKAELERKRENARLLAEEEASAPPKPKPAPKAGKGKQPVKPAGPGAIAAGGGLGEGSSKAESEKPEEVEAYHATGLDNALDLLEVVTAKMDKASVGQRAADIERHPERRFKAAYAAYEERELPNLKVEHPGLRLQQYKDLLHKQFQKSPENPFNQTSVAYDASKEEKLEALNKKKANVEQRLREKH
ncbi:DUF1014-domain-containing protein [Coprinellus micaceus]|uniref:DUF1014-domain-containing protein n=1 Tax=Coprinellus micaceus TaxID=71717 RepID=A0A4Y7TB62_COPMI|nr:DUF1014-domain-containing protein [Coprinellus micaceus]